jgi:hypothetical protein
MIGTLKINGVELELSSSLFVPLNYAIADAREPQKRKRNTSQVIALPGTKTNKDFFFSAWNLGLSDERGDGIGFNYDPTLRYPAIYTQHGQTIFRGAATLDGVTVNKDQFTFNVILYSDVVDVFQGLGDLTLNQLDWSAYNEILSIANIQASWTAAVGSGIWWPLIDFGFTSNLLEYKTNELFPYVYAKEVFEKAFALSNLTIDSTFFDTSNFKNLTIGYGGGKKLGLSAAQVTQRQSSHGGDGTWSRVVGIESIIPSVGSGAAGSNTATYNPDGTLGIENNSVVTMSVVADPVPQYTATTGRLTVENTGEYNIAFSGTFPTSWSFTGGSGGTGSARFKLVANIRRNGAIIATDSQIVFDVPPGSTSWTPSISQGVYLVANDVIEFELVIERTGGLAITYVYDPDTDLPPTAFNLDIDLDASLLFNLTSTQAELIDGDLVDVSGKLPPIKVSDILDGFIKAFNLYVGEPDERGVVSIEPLTDFYATTDNAIQMSDKVDYSKPMKIEAASGIEGKRYLFKFTEDLDYYKKLYFDQFGEHYGDYVYNVPSTFKKGDRIYKLPFAQSVPVQIAGTEIIIPRVISFDPVNQVSEPYKGKARVFYNQGQITLVSDTWTLVNSASLIGGPQTTYPRAHHLNDLAAPSFDFNFGVPRIVYYTATAYTTFNLFSGYHDQFIRELTGRDSKFLQVYMKLDESDLQGEFLRNLWNIKGTIFRINVIKEYDGNGEATTWTELIRINEGTAPATYLTPAPEGPEETDTKTFKFPDTVLDKGLANTLGLKSQNVQVLGDNNTVNDNLKNVAVWGDSNTATKSNTFYNSLKEFKTANGTFIVEVFRASDMPGTLAANTTYIIRGTVILFNGITVTNDNCAVIGLDRNKDRIIFGGGPGTTLFTVTDVDFDLQSICLSANNSGSRILEADNYDAAGYNSGRLKVLTIFDCQFRNCFDMVSVEGFDLVDLSNTLFWYAQSTNFGVQFLNTSKIEISSCEFIRWFDETTIPTPSGYATVPMVEILPNGGGSGIGALNITGSVFHPQQGGDGIKINPLSTTGFATISANTFVDVNLTTGKKFFPDPLTGGYSNTECLTYDVFVNQGLPNSTAFGLMTMAGNANNTNLTANVPALVETDGLAVSTDVQRFTITTAGRMTYNGTKDINVTMSAALTYDKQGGGTDPYDFYFYKNGVQLAASVSPILAGGPRFPRLPMLFEVALVQNDYIEVWVENTSSNDNMLITSWQVLIKE